MDDPEITFAQKLGRALTPLFLWRARWTRAMTFGVRIAAFDREERVFLVKHTYVPGWFLPGGAVDPGETAEEAAHREAREEGNLVFTQPLELRGLYQNKEASVRDHVAFYVTRQVIQERARAPDREIASSGFFALADLPRDCTAATLRRLDELAGRRSPDGTW